MWFICGIFQRQIDFYHIRQKTIWYTLQGITCFFLFVCLFFVAIDLLDLLPLKSQDLKENVKTRVNLLILYLFRRKINS